MKANNDQSKECKIKFNGKNLGVITGKQKGNNYLNKGNGFCIDSIQAHTIVINNYSFKETENVMFNKLLEVVKENQLLKLKNKLLSNVLTKKQLIFVREQLKYTTKIQKKALNV